MSKSEKKTVKICVVCGDRANGYNFNAISCESCKAFFRRNALRKKVFKCTFNNNCVISVTSRKFCQKCRLQKCLNQGMNKKLILTDEERQLMKEKVQENKQKKNDYQNDNTNDMTAPCNNRFTQYSNESTLSHFENNLFVNKFIFTFQQDQSMINKPGQINCANHIPTITANVHQDYYNQRKENFDRYFLLKNFEQIFYKETQDYERRANTIAGLLASEDNPEYCGIQNLVPFSVNRGLNLLEQNRLEELNNAFIIKELPSIEYIQECVNQMDICKLIELSVRRLIKQMKRIDCFRCLCPLDQIALMKAGCTQINILRSVKGYNFAEQSWCLEQNGKSTTIVKMDIFKRTTTASIYETHKRFMKVISEEWDSDQNILNLLSMVILFNANRPDIIHKHLIAFEYQSHKYLLQRYLETKYSSKLESNKKFSNLMNILEDLYYLSEESVRWHLENSPQQINPLLIEIFDLK